MNYKELLWKLLNAVLVLLVIFGIKILFMGEIVPPYATRTITVSAEGKTTVVPDIARVSFSVVTEGKDPKVIQEENTKKMNSAIEFVKGTGVEAKDIKTSNYNLYPRYDYDPKPLSGSQTPYIIGYTVTQTVSLKIRDLEKVGEILGGLPEKGVNQIEQVSFDVDDPDAYLNEAREEAFTKARAKAEAMAKMNGSRIRRVITFSEGGGGYPVPMYFKAEAMMDGGRGGAVAPSLEPGSQDVTVSVSVTYEIK
jgi:uncharacterized protein YggE